MCNVFSETLPNTFNNNLTKARPNQILQDHRPRDSNQSMRVVLILPCLVGSYFSFSLQGDTSQWRDYVNISQIDMEISADSNEWIKCNSRKYTPRTSKRGEETAEYLVDQLYNYVR